MRYPLSEKYDRQFIHENIMGPNPIKLLEELFLNHHLTYGSTVLDLGCGRGVTSIFMAKEFGLCVYATDLWISATENKQRFDTMGLSSKEIIPIHAEAHALPFANEFFDAVVSVDSYHYFGLDKTYLGKYLLPLIKHGGKLLIIVPGMKKDIHDNIPPELLLSWRPEDLDTIHDTKYWQDILEKTDGIEALSVCEMESFDEVWDDWLSCDNEYAAGDRKTMNGDGRRFLNFIAIAAHRK